MPTTDHVDILLEVEAFSSFSYDSSTINAFSH